MSQLTIPTRYSHYFGRNRKISFTPFEWIDFQIKSFPESKVITIWSWCSFWSFFGSCPKINQPQKSKSEHIQYRVTSYSDILFWWFWRYSVALRMGFQEKKFWRKIRWISRDFVLFSNSGAKLWLRLRRYVVEAKKYPLTWNGYILRFCWDFSSKVGSIEPPRPGLSTDAKINEKAYLNRKLCNFFRWIVWE